MSRIRFYYNTALAKSERVTYYESQIEWKKPLKVYAVSANYRWNEAHTTANVLSHSLGEATLTKVTTKTVASLGLIVNADNISYNFTKADFGKVISGFVICNATKPIALIDKYEELPLKINGTKLTVNFYNGPEKLLAFNLTDCVVSNALLYQERTREIVKPTNIISRNNAEIAYDDEIDKSTIGGKSGVYKDISITGKAHPITGDLVSVFGHSAINQSLRNILLANTFDRPFSSKDVAGNLNAFLFDFNDNITHSELRSGIAIAIGNNEPRITVMDILIEDKIESYSLKVTITYMIKTTNNTQEFSILLDRA